jgi:hypothetical protein
MAPGRLLSAGGRDYTIGKVLHCKIARSTSFELKDEYSGLPSSYKPRGFQ